MKLTDRQRLFVAEYLIDRNATRAATRAGYSRKCARQVASRLLTKANVKLALTAELKAHEKTHSLKRDTIIRNHLSAINRARKRRDPLAMIVGARELGLLMGYYKQVR